MNPVHSSHQNGNEVGSSHCLRVVEANPGRFKGTSLRRIIKLLDLRARASVSTTREGVKRSAQSVPHRAKAQLKPVYLANAVSSCTVCGEKKHPLYACRKFRSLSHDKRIAAVRGHQLSLNCIKSGHHKLHAVPIIT